MSKPCSKWVLAALFILLTRPCLSQQVGDTNFNPEVASPAFTFGQGPVVLVDEAHFNYHTAEGRYKPFADLLRSDGYVVRRLTSRFAAESLEEGDILVISNALAEENAEDWVLPTPSAFSEFEIQAVREWVRGGGSLMLIADHMPFPGAAGDLAASFGVLFNNGYARDPIAESGLMTFRRSQDSLRAHSITNGRDSREKVDKVTAFTGQAFRAQPGTELEPLMVVADNTILLMTEAASHSSEKTPRLSAAGWFQGAVLHFGEGRLAVFGEAAMFSAQVSGPDRRPMGMNHPDAAQNAQFLLNVIHWLSGLLP